MLTFEDALARVLGSAPRLPSEIVALEDAVGRVLGEAVLAAGPLPPHDYSAMDGYAVDTRAWSESPTWLVVRGESRTGRIAPRLESGTACRIFTGAPIPAGADAVVMQENVERDADRIRVLVRPSSGDHVRRAGEDIAGGATALEVGTRLGPYQLGLCAAVDRGTLVVSRRPRVTVIATGDELRRPGSSARTASIPESNGVVIAALASAAGATVRVAESAADDLDDARLKFAAALDASDLLVTIGGVSVGDHDVVRPALEAAGAALEFHKVAMKPGKPLTLGRRGATLVLGLPGNPMSAQITFTLFGVPLLRRMQGDTRATPAPRFARLGAPLRQRAGRRGYYVATLSGDVVTPLGGQASGSAVSLAHADALVVMPAERELCDVGTIVETIVLRDV